MAAQTNWWRSLGGTFPDLFTTRIGRSFLFRLVPSAALVLGRLSSSSDAEVRQAVE